MTSEFSATDPGFQSGANRTQDPEDPAPSGVSASPASGYQDVLRQLSQEERSALAALAHDPPRQSVPRYCAARLLHLGLAELDCGRLLLTVAGRQAVASMIGRQGSGAAGEAR